MRGTMVLKKIHSKYQKSRTESEYKLCVNRFPYLFNKYLENGHVNDVEFNYLGIPMDKDVDTKKGEKRQWNRSGKLTKSNGTYPWSPIGLDGPSPK